MKKEIPTIEQLKSGAIDLSPLQQLLENEPPKEWLKDLEVTKDKVKQVIKYLPIERVDYLLRSIYSDNWCEILSTGIYNNSCQVTLRLFVLYPINEKENHVHHVDGIGGASSLAGVDVALALAKSNAKKNASKELGKIFGRDLSREIEVNTADKTEEKEHKEQLNEYQFELNHVRDNFYKHLLKKASEKGLSKSIIQLNNRIISEEIEQDNYHIKKEMLNQLKDTLQKTKSKENLILSKSNFLEIAKLGYIEPNNEEILLILKAQCLKYGIEFSLDNL